MSNFRNHLIPSGSLIKEALVQLNQLGQDAILFVVDDKNKLLGSLTDGDIRRGLIKNISIVDTVDEVLERNPKVIQKEDYDVQKLINFRNQLLKIIPILDQQGKIVNVVNFREHRSYLPIDVIIMAGGRGERLRPMTDQVPKPLLKIGNKPIIEYNLDRLALFGICNFWISVRYLGHQIESYFGNGNEKGVKIEYVWENEPLGTIGAAANIKNFEHDYILITNSDLLTNIDYENFFLEFIHTNADLSVVTIPYKVNIPYAVLETQGKNVTSLKEKPLYTYYSNAGIYLMKRKHLNLIPEHTHYNATSLLEKMIEMGYLVTSYSLNSYWIDIGNKSDFEKAQVDIEQIKF